MPNTKKSHRLALVWACVCLLASACTTAPPDDASEPVQGVRGAPPVAAAATLPVRLQGYIDALNAGDVEQLFRFYDTGVTESFRTRRSEDEDRAFYDMLTRDLGHLDVRRMERESDEQVTMVAHSSAKDMPVTFVFRIREERIDGLQLRLGESPRGPTVPVRIPDELPDTQLAQTLDEQLAALAADDRFSGTVLLARGGAPFFHRAYGLANRATSAPNETTTAFDIGSITKLITRIAIARLAQEGRLSLEGRLIDYLPEYPGQAAASSITVQHLLDHSSGLGDIFNARWEQGPRETYIEPADFFALFADEPLQFEPGTGRAYSNAGFVVLGAIVEAVSGMAYSDYVEATVFAPAGMVNSGFEWRDGTNPSLAVGYTRAAPDDSLVDNLDRLPVKGCPAGSSMHTAQDLLRLDVALRGGRLLDPAWTAWVFGQPTVPGKATYPIAIAGGGQGVSAGLVSDGNLTSIVLSNFDPPTGEALAEYLYQVASAP